MTGRTEPPAELDSDHLLSQLRTLRDAPLLQRANGSLRLAELTVTVIRRLEIRIARLEGKSNGEKPHA